jgi:hypothetical protein
VDANGDVYVVDPGNHRVQKFSNDGTFVPRTTSLWPRTAIYMFRMRRILACKSSAMARRRSSRSPGPMSKEASALRGESPAFQPNLHAGPQDIARPCDAWPTHPGRTLADDAGRC